MKSKFNHHRPPLWILKLATPQWDGINRIDTDPTTDSPEDQSPTDDIERLKGALGKERENARALAREMKMLKAQLEAFAGIEPDKAKEALEIAKKQEEFERQQAEQRARLEAEIRGQYEPQLSELQKQLQQVSQSAESYKLNTLLEREYQAADGLPGEFVAIAHALQARVKLDPTSGEPRVLDANGQVEYVVENGQSRPKTVAHLITELKGDPKYTWFARHFRGNERSGFGISGSTAGGDINPALTGWERVAALREKRGRA